MTTTSEPIYSVVMPAYQEEENLRLMLPRLKTVMAALGYEYEIIIVDTVHPLDNTYLVCQDHNVKHIHRAPTDSFGDAVRTGVAAAQGQWTIWMDADGSHTPEFIPKLVKRVTDSDVVIASRYVDGGSTENPWILIATSRLLNASYKCFFGLRCKDISNSFRVYPTVTLKELHLKCDNFDIIEEILIKIVRKNPAAVLTEVPFTFKKRMFGDTKRNLLAFMLSYLLTMVRLRLFLKKP